MADNPQGEPLDRFEAVLQTFAGVGQPIPDRNNVSSSKDGRAPWILPASDDKGTGAGWIAKVFPYGGSPVSGYKVGWRQLFYFTNVPRTAPFTYEGHTTTLHYTGYSDTYELFIGFNPNRDWFETATSPWKTFIQQGLDILETLAESGGRGENDQVSPNSLVVAGDTVKKVGELMDDWGAQFQNWSNEIDVTGSWQGSAAGIN